MTAIASAGACKVYNRYQRNEILGRHLESGVYLRRSGCSGHHSLGRDLSIRQPIVGTEALNGCYEDVGLPDIIRPPRHWAFSVRNGEISDRSGHQVSTIRAGPDAGNSTRVAFSPGILIAGKPEDVSVGQATGGRAYIKRGIVRIAVPDEAGDLMQKTSCN